MPDVTDKDREAAKRFVYDYNVRDIFQSREGPIEDLTDIIARARAEERAQIHATLTDLPEPFAYRHDPIRLDAFNEGVQHAMDAIRARGEKGKD